MSSILKALRKLEEEKQKGEADIAFPAGSLGRPDQRLYEKRKSPWARVSVPFLMVMLLGGGWFGRAYFKEADMPVTRQALKEAPPAQDQAQLAGRAAELAVAAEPVLPVKHQVGAGAALKNPEPNKAAAILPRPDPLPVAPEEESSQEEEEATTGAGPPLAPKEEPRTQTQANEAGARPDDSIPVLHNAPLKVQALVWSENPGKRMAVINNLVLKEGDRIESFQIARIDADAIVVNADGHVWQIPFGSK